MNVSSPIGCLPSADEQFGPVVQGCRDGFDFTLTFEQYFFSIAPASLLLIAAPLRIRHLSRLPDAVRAPTFRHIKLAVITLFAVLQLTLVALWGSTKSDLGVLRSAAIASSSLSFVASLISGALSYIEHAKSVKPSSILSAYLFISLILDGATLRTIWLSALVLSSPSIRAISTCAFVLKGTILILEAIQKRSYVIDNGVERSPEDFSGIFSRGLFWWLNSLLLSGFRQLLAPTDLFPVEESMSSAVLSERFWKTWDRDSYNGKHKLLSACIRTLKGPLAVVFFPRLVLLAFTICQPLLLNRFLLYLETPAESSNIGYGLIAAYGLVYLGMAISGAFYWHKAYRVATMLRGILVSAVFKKTTEISITTTDNSASVTLMSTDVDAITRAMRTAHELWADALQVSLATWLLSRQIGPAAAAPVIVCLLALGLTIYISPKAQGSQGRWIKKVQERVGVTSKMLGHMKSIKFSGLIGKLSAIISQMRVDEIAAAQPFRIISVCSASLAQVPLLLSPVAAFAVFAIVAVRTGQTFEATRLFSSLSLIILLASPLFGTFETLLDLYSALACFDRIQEYLCREPRRETRVILESRRRSGTGASMQHDCPSQDGSNVPLNDGIELGDIPTASQSYEHLSAGSVDIELRSSSFAWSADADFVIKQVSMTAAKGQVIVIMGPVASGKSTLLKGILGEVPISTGSVQIAQARTSWCDQTPWLKNESVRENIIGFSHFDSDLYQHVIHACDLQKDLAQFPDGDETIVGSKGITLSGGQKQRVALARAVYSRPQIALFDDVLSGLDNQTSKVVCNRLFGKQAGMLRKWDTTVVIATQSSFLLSMADRIVILNEDGIIAESGSLYELLRRDGYVRSISKAPTSTVDEDIIDTTPPMQAVNGQPQKASKTHENRTDNRRQVGDTTVYRYYFSALGAVFTAFLLVVEIANAFLSTFPTVWLKWWSDASAAEGNQSLGLYLGVYAALQVAGVVAFALMTWFVFLRVVAKTGVQLHHRLLNAVTRAPLSLFTTEDTGSITTRFSQDIGIIDRNLPLGMQLTNLEDTFIVIGQAVLIASATFYIAISFPMLLAVFYFLQKAYLRTSRQLRFLDLDEKAPVYTQFLETLAGLSTIRAFSWQDNALQRNHRLVDRSQKPFYLLLMAQRWLALVLDVTVAALALLVVGLAFRLRESVSVGLTGVSLVQLITFAETVKMLVQWWTSVETSMGAVARVKQFGEHTPDENLPRENGAVPVGWPARGVVEIRNVSASYDGSCGDNRALDGVSVSVGAGEKLGVVGRTGSGKSSLLLSIVRMLDLSAGSITIDDVDLSTLPREDVRSRLITITQDQFFLPGSVRQNVDPYGTSTTEEITDVLAKVGLWETIAQRGLDGDFEEEMLSHGQRQLFFLARAILRKSSGGKVVLLDEATSSVDQFTESRVQELIRDEFRDHTVVAIAHRLDTVIGFDRLVVLENGYVVQQGKPGDLLQVGGPFKELWDAAHVSIS